MKRRYTRREYRDIVAGIRARCPEIALSSDFIVGFPGETDADFEDTLALVRPPCGSPASSASATRRGRARLRRGGGGDSEVPDEVASARLRRLLDLQTEIQRTINAALVGRDSRS